MAIVLGHNHWSKRHHANAVIHPITGKEMEYSALVKDTRLQPLWTRGFGNECGRLFQGIRDLPGTDTCFFITLKNIPTDRKITYGRIVCDYKPHKQEKERVRLTVWGDKLNYSGDVATSTANITTFIIPINSTLSTKDAAMMMMDIKNYYLGTPLPRFEYMQMLMSHFLRRSSRSTTSTLWPSTVGCTLKSEKSCTIWSKQVFWRTNYFKLVYHLLGNTHTGTPRDYGYTKLDLSLSRSLSTTSQ
jgi:hypothetical protein